MLVIGAPTAGAALAALWMTDVGAFLNALTLLVGLAAVIGRPAWS